LNSPSHRVSNRIYRTAVAIAAAPAQPRLRARFTVFADHVAHREPRSGSPGEATETCWLSVAAWHITSRSLRASRLRSRKSVRTLGLRRG
jgi:hypothetical protein